MRAGGSSVSARAIHVQFGFTLVELLIALAVFMVFLGSLFWLFVGGLDADRLVGEQSRSVQESEGVLQLLTYELGLAGFRGTGATPLEFDDTGVTGGALEKCRTEVFSVCVQLSDAPAGDAVWIRFFEVGGPVADAFPERWISYRVRGDVLERTDHLEGDVQNRVQDLVGGVDAIVIEGFVRRNRSVVDRAGLDGNASFWENLSSELAGIRLRAEFSDESVWRFVVGLSNPQTVRVFD